MLADVGKEEVVWKGTLLPQRDGQTGVKFNIPLYQLGDYFAALPQKILSHVAEFFLILHRPHTWASRCRTGISTSPLLRDIPDKPSHVVFQERRRLKFGTVDQ